MLQLNKHVNCKCGRGEKHEGWNQCAECLQENAQAVMRDDFEPPADPCTRLNDIGKARREALLPARNLFSGTTR